MAHAFDNHNASLSEGAPSLLWWRPCLESLIGGGLARIPRVGCDKAKRGCASRVPASPGAPHGREEGGGSDPRFLPLVRHRRGLSGAYSDARLTLPTGGRSLHNDPCGKAEMPLQSVSSSRPYASAESKIPFFSSSSGEL